LRNKLRGCWECRSKTRNRYWT